MRFDRSIYYPDVTVLCGKVEPKDLFIESPKLIVELLSLSGAVTFRSIGLELKMEHIYEQAL